MGGNPCTATVRVNYSLTVAISALGTARLATVGANRTGLCTIDPDVGSVAVAPLAKTCFVAGLGVFIRANVQIPVISGFLAFFVSVRTRFGTLAKIASYARFIVTCTLARLFTPNRSETSFWSALAGVR